MAVASEQRLVWKNGLHRWIQRKNLVQATWLVSIYLSWKGIRSSKISKFELYDVITLDLSLVWKNGLHRWIQRKNLVQAVSISTGIVGVGAQIFGALELQP